MGERSDKSDLVLVGGGIIALAIAFELLERGRSVVVLERDRVGAGASTVAAGMLAPTSEAMVEHPLLVGFGLDSLRRYPDFVSRVERVSGIPCGYRRDGTLWVGLHQDHERELRRLHAVQQERGLVADWLSGAEVLELEPRLTGRTVCGLFVRGDHQVDSTATVASLARAVERRGGTIATGHTVESVRPAADGGLVVAGELRAADGVEPFELRSRAAVIAAGAWSSASIESPAREIGVRPVKGQIVRLAGEELIRHVLFTPDVYVVPRRGGELIVGGTMEEQGFDGAPRAWAVKELLRRAFELLPGIDEMEICSLPVSFRPAVRDHMPVIGPTGTRELYVATGHHRNGILLAPATAHYVAEMIVTGVVPSAVAPFTMDRDALRGGGARPAAAHRSERGRAPEPERP